MQETPSIVSMPPNTARSSTRHKRSGFSMPRIAAILSGRNRPIAPPSTLKLLPRSAAISAVRNIMGNSTMNHTNSSRRRPVHYNRSLRTALPTRANHN